MINKKEKKGNITIYYVKKDYADDKLSKVLNKKAACLLTVSDNLVTQEETSSEERQNAFTKMMDIALGLAE